MLQFFHKMSRKSSSARGGTLLEQVILVTLLGIAVIPALQSFSAQTNNKLEAVAYEMGGGSLSTTHGGGAGGCQPPECPN